MVRRLRAVAIATALTVPLLLSGCTGVSDESIRQDLTAEVLAEVPHATHALISVNSDGLPTQRGVGIKVYLDRATPEDVAEAVDKALDIAWSNFPVEPVRVSVIVVDGPYSAGDSYSTMDGVDLNQAARTLGLGSSDYDQLTVHADDLAAKYGAWGSSTK